MEKSVYSLVLADEIVLAIDGVASSRGMSRSNLVNHILAEYVSMVTPETRNNRVLDSLKNAALISGMRVDSRSMAALTMKTALCYKYNPALAYTVEMQNTGEYLGSLRLSLRSQNQAVLSYFADFIHLWTQLETQYLPQPPAQKMEEKKYSRAFRRLPIEEEVGQAVAHYVDLLNSCMKTFFQNVDQMQLAADLTERYYISRIQQNQNSMLL